MATLAEDIKVGTYQWMRAWLGGMRMRRLMDKTHARIFGSHGTIIVSYGARDMMMFQKNGTILLTPGKERTVAIKFRYNNYLPAQNMVYVKWGQWFLTAANGVFLFADGIVIDEGGNVVPGDNGFMPERIGG